MREGVVSIHYCFHRASLLNVFVGSGSKIERAGTSLWIWKTQELVSRMAQCCHREALSHTFDVQWTNCLTVPCSLHGSDKMFNRFSCVCAFVFERVIIVVYIYQHGEIQHCTGDTK